MDISTMLALREVLRERANNYELLETSKLRREELAVLEGRMEELEDIIELIDKELLLNPETLIKS